MTSDIPTTDLITQRATDAYKLASVFSGAHLESKQQVLTNRHTLPAHKPRQGTKVNRQLSDSCIQGHIQVGSCSTFSQWLQVCVGGFMFFCSRLLTINILQVDPF